MICSSVVLCHSLLSPLLIWHGIRARFSVCYLIVGVAETKSGHNRSRSCLFEVSSTLFVVHCLKSTEAVGDWLPSRVRPTLCSMEPKTQEKTEPEITVAAQVWSFGFPILNWFLVFWTKISHWTQWARFSTGTRDNTANSLQISPKNALPRVFSMEVRRDLGLIMHPRVQSGIK